MDKKTYQEKLEELSYLRGWLDAMSFAVVASQEEVERNKVSSKEKVMDLISKLKIG